MAYTRKMAGKVPVLKQDLVFDATPTLGSENAVTSGGVAEAVGNVAEQTEQDMKDMEEMFLVNLPCAANTLRFEFSKMDYDPTVAGVGSSGTWKKVNAKFHNVWDWTRDTVAWTSSFENKFNAEDNLVSVIACGDLSSVKQITRLFRGCSSLITCCDLSTSTSLTAADNAFDGCINLEVAPILAASSNVTTFYAMFYDCRKITRVPLYDTSSATNVSNMFQRCYNVESGALALYEQMSTQATVPTTHSKTFELCGRDTTTGAAELAQIPGSWGGTGPEPE